ncbi:MAG: hypothetical protein OEV53_01570 [Nitrospira sp.]|nr:hypothetical protein [Nitrospira sp.]MDH5192135.1 hypothetical protein [Nitrospira sp.]
MRPIITPIRSAYLALFLFTLTAPGLLVAAEKSSASILVKDALTAQGQPATIEAKLFSKRLMLIAELGGEPLELVADGKVVAKTLTGGDGRAFLTYTPKAQGLALVQVRIGNSPRVDQAEGQANLAVWEKRQPILVIELSSLLEQSAPNRVPPIGIAFESARKPMPGAADELGKLTQFYYKVIYVVEGRDGFQRSAEAREWLKTHKFPAGYLLTLPVLDTNTVGETIDELHAAGWRTVKVGVGRSKSFAEAFLQRRLEAIMVPGPSKGEVPRKAKVAKDWKEVRKKL